MKTEETIDLLRKIRTGATGNDMPLGELLRLCMRLGLQLKNKQLTEWARQEASGYKEAAELPDYRILNSEVRGTFYGPFQSGIKNAHIPKMAVDEDHRDVLFHIHLFEPISQLEQYARLDGEDSSLKVMWPADVIAFYGQREIYSNGLVLASAWRVTSSQNVRGVLEIVRTRVLDFVLQIQDELGFDIDEPITSTALETQSPQTVTNIVNNTIYGGNVALSNQGNAAVETLNIQTGNIEQLNSYLKELGLSQKELKELSASIKQDGSIKDEVGPAVSTWLSKVSIKALKGGYKAGKTIATTLIAQAIAKYYGLN